MSLNVKFALLAGVALVALGTQETWAQDENLKLTCNMHKPCSTSGAGTPTDVTDINECIQICKDADESTPCTYFQYTEGDTVNTCEFLTECDIGSDAVEDSSITVSQPECYDGAELICNYPRACIDGSIVGTFPSFGSMAECKETCYDNPSCALYTHFNDSSLCLQYSSCDVYESDTNDDDSDDEVCSDCITNLSGDNINCNGLGSSCGGGEDTECSSGTLVGTPSSGIGTADDCHQLCVDQPGCSIYTWYNSIDYCFLYSSCEEYMSSPGDFTGCLPVCQEEDRTCGEGSQTLDVEFGTENVDECRALCQDNCAAYSQYGSDFCILYSDCPTFQDCDGCVTGLSDCTNFPPPEANSNSLPACDPVDYACGGSPVGYVYQETIEGCKQACLDNDDGCQWYTYYSDGTCGLFEDCDLIETDKPCYCKSGPAYCEDTSTP